MSLLSALRGALADAARTRNRLPVILTGDDSWITQQLEQVCQATPSLLDVPANSDPRLLWLSTASERPSDAWQQGRHRNCRGLLGQEFDCVVHDLRLGINPDSIAQASGLVRAGGLYLLVLPELHSLHQFADPEAQFLSSTLCDSESSRPSTPVGRCFQQRLQRMLLSDELTPLPMVTPAGLLNFDLFVSLANVDHYQDADGFLSADQSRAANYCLARLRRGRRPVVLSAGRGRGKSALLGILGAELMRQGRSVVLTAPSIESCDSALKSANERGVKLEFLSPLGALELDPEGRVLLVDEAAAIPVPLLTRLTERYSRILFATTRQGYEGTGQGFTQRFLPILKRLMPDCRECELEEPIRWSREDPLERWCNAWLLLDMPKAPAPELDSCSVSIRKVEPGELLQDEALLANVFKLLVNAHYRTTPSDLRWLLDGPDQHLWLACSGREVVGVLQVVEEGGYQLEFAEQVQFGRRRPRGDLIAQIFAAQKFAPELAFDVGGRVMRIAVSPSKRREKIATQLLQCAQRFAKGRWTWFGASFSASASVIGFWHQQQTSLIEIGEKSDPLTGSLPIVMLKPLTPRMASAFAKFEAEIATGLSWYLPERLGSLAAEDLVALVKALPVAERDQRLEPALQTFAYGHASLRRVSRELALWLTEQIRAGVLEQRYAHSPDLMREIVGCCLQRKSPQNLSVKRITDELRVWLRQWLGDKPAGMPDQSQSKV